MRRIPAARARSAGSSAEFSPSMVSRPKNGWFEPCTLPASTTFVTSLPRTRPHDGEGSTERLCIRHPRDCGPLSGGRRPVSDSPRRPRSSGQAHAGRPSLAITRLLAGCPQFRKTGRDRRRGRRATATRPRRPCLLCSRLRSAWPRRSVPSSPAPARSPRRGRS